MAARLSNRSFDRYAIEGDWMFSNVLVGGDGWERIPTRGEVTSAPLLAEALGRRIAPRSAERRAGWASKARTIPVSDRRGAGS